jgi:2C-methyl-D-erythritol 2,4-cyclodiphosphate synthase
VQSLCCIATTIRQELQDHSDETDILRHSLQLSAYSIGFIDLVINKSKRSVGLMNEVQPLGFIPISHVQSVSEKFDCKANKYSRICSFNTRNTLRNSLM